MFVYFVCYVMIYVLCIIKLSNRAFFFFSHDSKYMVKTVTKSEANLLLSILHKFLNYLENEKLRNNRSKIVEILGLYSLQMYTTTIYFIVLKNVFYCDLTKNLIKLDEIYDIKGSWIDRSTNHYVESGKLMKDCDLHKTLKLSKNESNKLYNQLKRDSVFLSKCNIMDYSLLLGIKYISIATNEDKEIHHYGVAAQMVQGPGVYYMAIIDMLQEWNISKKLERIAKKYFKCKDGKGISCIEPIRYQSRFVDEIKQIAVN